MRTTIAWLGILLLAVGGTGCHRHSSTNIIEGTVFDDILIGSSDADVIRGYEGNDEIEGRGGSDLIEGGPGADDIDGDTGSDTATYESSRFGVDVDLTNSVQEDGDAEGDELDSIENLRGSSNDDELRGNAEDNDIYGDSGGDLLRGREGNDHLDGGRGDDTLLGEEGTDTLTGGDGADRLEGDEDDDTLLGGDGDDQLDGGTGADVLNGGDDDDELVWDSADSLVDGGAGQDRLIASGELDLGSVTSRLRRIEIVDLTDAQANQLHVDPDDVAAISEDDRSLRIDGDAGDTVMAEGGVGTWQLSPSGPVTLDGQSYDVYTAVSGGGVSVTLYVLTSIGTVQL